LKVTQLLEHSLWMPGKFYSKPAPDISIILPTFRRGASGYFLKCAQSILNQSLESIELIIVDDCSTDGTFDQIKSLMESDGRVSCIRHQKNVGLPAVSTFEAFLKCRASIIGFAFDDNEFFPNAFSELKSYIEKDNLDVAYGYVEMNVDDPVGGKYQILLGADPVPISTLESHNFIPNNAVILKRSVIETVGWYDPHILMTRLCDWDLWRRIAMRFKLAQVPVRVGIEHGPALNDSLGATYKMDLWAIEEWTRDANRNISLSTTNFLNYDFTTVPETSSSRLKHAADEISWNFKSKFWGQSFGENTDENKKILIVTPHLDASVTLYFESYPESIAKKIRIIQSRCWRKDQIVGASLVIFIRDLITFESDGWVDMCRLHNIPHYFFLDDNFFEISKEIKGFEAWDFDKVKKYLSSFSGVLCSSEELKSYFVKHIPEIKSSLFPPKIISDATQLGQYSEEIVFGYAGGEHRLSPFKESVIPAIFELAKTTRVSLVICAQKKYFDNIVFPKNVNATFIEPTLALREVLRSFAKNKVNIFVHPGQNSINNPYKVKHMVVLCKILKSSLVVSNIPPYKEQDIEDGVYLAENTVDSWLKQLKLLTQSSARKDSIERLSSLCDTSYSGKVNIECIKDMLQSAEPVGPITVENRLNLVWRQLEQQPRLEGSNRDIVASILKAAVKRRVHILVRKSSIVRWAYFSLKKTGIADLILKRI